MGGGISGDSSDRWKLTTGALGSTRRIEHKVGMKAWGRVRPHSFGIDMPDADGLRTK